MRYWWVNQNQTYRHEIGGGYLWSPKRKSNGQRNPFYEFMREVAPGDVIFSFSDTRVAALGIARSFCYESPKPQEFGATGTNWSQIGWKVDVAFRELQNNVRPMDHLAELRPLLPARYAPLRAENGHGLQSVYLTEVSTAFAMALYRLIGREVQHVTEAANSLADTLRDASTTEPTLDEWERRVEQKLSVDSEIRETEREALVLARRGQGLFRQNVQRVEHACRVTRVDKMEHLVASHTKPWRDCGNAERLDGENGLLLTPTVDHLFDKGFISFEDSGRLIVSPVAHGPSLQKMGIDPASPMNVGSFSSGQRNFLAYHRDNVLRLARVSK